MGCFSPSLRSSSAGQRDRFECGRLLCTRDDLDSSSCKSLQTGCQRVSGRCIDWFSMCHSDQNRRMVNWDVTARGENADGPLWAPTSPKPVVSANSKHHSSEFSQYLIKSTITRLLHLLTMYWGSHQQPSDTRDCRWV